ncbi:hypothetical protein EGR_07577 [Echinococcus granulosus]|uniref:Uncharacterized protein n=1 Tax=Echinococcus granulosus TaxID=6210 RepID=W6UAK4_ECHGR|nr:hypothetical protein EGR_07577 [Echinococcus granulosus]EUB57566.1 hypothetical protein EGR_07577 [Echinococcus granulosus]
MPPCKWVPSHASTPPMTDSMLTRQLRQLIGCWFATSYMSAMKVHSAVGKGYSPVDRQTDRRKCWLNEQMNEQIPDWSRRLYNVTVGMFFVAAITYTICLVIHPIFFLIQFSDEQLLHNINFWNSIAFLWDDKALLAFSDVLRGTQERQLVYLSFAP